MTTGFCVKRLQEIDSKFATVGRWHLLEKIGTGYNSKVKLGYDPLTGELVAVKIIPLDHPKLNPRHLAAESYALKTLDHPNVIKLIEYLDEIDYCKKNGSTYKVVAFVLELAPNGNLFQLISSGARFEESMVRKIFQQILETIEYCHEQKFAHRDLKPENILFDKDYNLKVADFGFSISLLTEDGKKGCDAFLGTEAYMAPELNQEKPYCPAQADLYALGIILFLLCAGCPPFKRAAESDSFFKFFVKKPELFWKAHEKNKPKLEGRSFFNEEFKTLINSMLALDPSKRLSISEIKSSVWYQGAMSSSTDLQQEIKRIFEETNVIKNDEEIVEEVKNELAEEKVSKIAEKQLTAKKIMDKKQGELVMITAQYTEKRAEEEEFGKTRAEDPVNMNEGLSGNDSQVKVMS